MSYKQTVERQMSGGADELNHRKELWKKIFTAYEEGGEDKIKSVLTRDADKITTRFEEFLNQLREKL